MEFTKMEAAGNDFVLFNGFKYSIDDYENLAKSPVTDIFQWWRWHTYM